MRAARVSVLLALVCAAAVLPGQAHAQLPRTGVRLLAPFAAVPSTFPRECSPKACKRRPARR